MRQELIEKSLARIGDRELLVNIAARRARELANGAHPLVNVDVRDRSKYLDIALREIAEGLIGYEMVDQTNPPSKES